MDKNFYKWSGMIIFLIILIAVLIIDSQSEIKNMAQCKALRIMPLTEKFFTWNGIVELNINGKYQPKCL